MNDVTSLERMLSLLQTGPRGLLWRFVDQIGRKWTGAPVWRLSRVTPNLYVGGQHSAKGWPAMEQVGITAVINLREAHHDDQRKGIGGAAHLHLPTRDNTPPRLEDLELGVAFIRQELARGGKVYVHCGVGVGRAPSLVAAYLISIGYDVDAAIRYIRRARPFIHLTPGQMRRLREYAAKDSLKNKLTVVGASSASES